MNQYAKLMVVAWAILALPVNDVLARGGRGGGGRGGGGGGGGRSFSGGGYSRPAPSRSPTMSHQSRPSPSHTRSPSASRVARPANPGGRTARPGGPGASTRPAGGGRPGGHASQAELQSFLNLSGGQHAGNRAGAAVGGRPAGANSAINNFLHNPSGSHASRETVAGNRSGRIDQRTDGRSNLRDSRGENRDFASDNRQDRVSGRGDRQSVRVENRGDLRSSLADGRGERRTPRQQQLGEHADRIRDGLSNHYDNNHLFDNFWGNNPNAHYRFHQNPVFWTWASFATVSSFMPWNWGGAASYDYGSGGNVYYEGDTVYADGEEIPAEEYAAQAEQIATNVPEVEKPDEMKWLPLGVFALTQDTDSNAVPNMFIQLAVSKEGILAGTYQNKTTEQTQTLEGMVDRETQRAAWTIVDKNTPILETGISNLTQNETSVLMHFEDGQTQQWLMVRIDKPKEEAK
ncbi:MAG: hypothetical protein GXP26_09495 [Planctomycetes bacterium]|nr:hypothetical protein [Planctomycetota bacterium]